jgi:hypothetical protein
VASLEKPALLKLRGPAVRPARGTDSAGTRRLPQRVCVTRAGLDRVTETVLLNDVFVLDAIHAYNFSSDNRIF